MSKKVGTHRALPLVNSVTLSGQVARELPNAPALFELVMRGLERPTVPGWLVLRPIGVPRVSIGESGSDFFMDEQTAVARGQWDAVYIGRGKRHWT